MENRALIALALSFLIFVVFMVMGEKLKRPAQAPSPPPPAATRPEAPAPAAPAVARPAPAPTPTAPRAPLARPAREVVVDTPLYRAVFTELGARLKSFQLKKYWEGMPFTPISSYKLGPVAFELERYQDPDKARIQPKELVHHDSFPELPLGLSWEGTELTVPATLPCRASREALTLKAGEKGSLSFTGVSPEGLTFTRTYTFKSDSYAFDLAVKVANQSAQALEGNLDLELAESFTGEGGRRQVYGFTGSINHRLEEAKPGSFIKKGSPTGFKTFSGKVDWAGLDEPYFLTAMVPLAAPKALVTLKEAVPGPMVVTLRTPVEALAPGYEAQFSYALYFGPKDLDDLKPLNLGLERAVSFGWFDFLGKPLLLVLKFFDRFTHNYGWAIIILTILIRVLFFYPNHKSYKSMKEMQKLQPKVAKIREKHKDDKEAMNKELMALYRTFKVNPLAGCLPMVLQLPVFIALYNVLGYAIELRHTAFISTLPFTQIVWLSDLSAKDPLLITPLVMGATMFIQQKMTPSPGDPAQAKMMQFLPLIFTFLFLNFASGLVLYWLVNNILSIIQQYYTNKYLV
jgi:YidC/Oxa1 family membrane protein insertase